MLKGFVLMMKFMHSSTDITEYAQEIKNFLGSQESRSETPTADERNVSVQRDATEIALSKAERTMEDPFTEGKASVSTPKGEKIVTDTEGTSIDVGDTVNHVQSTISRTLSENEIRMHKNYIALLLKGRTLQNGHLMSCL
jgi:hypothetical protein